jgi:hypothetical protein
LLRSTGYTVGVRVNATAVPVVGVNVIPVIPTVAEITDIFDKETGVDVIVTARLAF